MPAPLNLLREDLPLPAAVVYQSRLANNLRWMQDFAAQQQVLLAPHGNPGKRALFKYAG